MSLENVNDIPKEELMQLCMKMNKRMQAMETKGKELVKRKATLLHERRKLLEFVKVVVESDTPDEDNLDLERIETRWTEYEKHREEQRIDLEQQLSDLDHKYKLQLTDTQLGKLSSPSPDGTVTADETNKTNSTDIRPSSEMAKLLEEKEKLYHEFSESQTKMKKLEAELTRLRNAEEYAKAQLKNMEGVINEKTIKVDELTKQIENSKAEYEEKVLSIQMAAQNASVNASRDSDDAKEKEISNLRKQLEKASGQLQVMKNINEEKEISVKSNRDMIQALQARLIEVEPELTQARDKLKKIEAQNSAGAMLQAEQQAEFNKLKKDLKNAFEQLQEASQTIAKLEDYKANAEGKLLKMAALQDQVSLLQTAVDDKTSLISRLRTEAQTAERSHAMRTAMLATVEAQLQTVQEEQLKKDEALAESNQRVTSLQASLRASEVRLAERVAESSKEIEELAEKLNESEERRESEARSMVECHESALNTIKADHAKKSGMARTMLSQREEEVRVLTAKVQELQEEISSGAPTERKIFELAGIQANRDRTHGHLSDAREYAFQQLQASLAAKDLELAKCQHQLSSLIVETTELRRQHSREGINMDYLKNIMFQFMTFPNNSSEKNSLVPVLAMLLQFTPAEMVEIHEASNRSEVQSWSLFGSTGQSPAAVPMKKPQSHRTAASPSPLPQSARNGSHSAVKTPVGRTATILQNGGAESKSSLSAVRGSNSNSSSSRFGHMSTGGSKDKSPQRGIIIDNSNNDNNNNNNNRNAGQRRYAQQATMSAEQHASSNSLTSADSSDQELQQKLNQMTSHDILNVSLSYDDVDTPVNSNSPEASAR